ncbi:MAG: hypothetical protein JNK37_08420 [Verrucomicrobiales bacterium]|nr:hypothetical protein [Verrucomicrobiales bacterium]
MAFPSQTEIVKASVVQAAINAVVNGVINYFMIRGTEVHLVTADSITSGNDTVVGHAVITAMILAVIFTLLGFKAHRKHLPEVGWRRVCGLAMHNAIYAFGLMIIAGVLWQKLFPNITVGTVGAATIAGLIAGAVSGITHYGTLTRLSE